MDHRDKEEAVCRAAGYAALGAAMPHGVDSRMTARGVFVAGLGLALTHPAGALSRAEIEALWQEALDVSFAVANERRREDA